MTLLRSPMICFDLLITRWVLKKIVVLWLDCMCSASTFFFSVSAIMGECRAIVWWVCIGTTRFCFFIVACSLLRSYSHWWFRRRKAADWQAVTMKSWELFLCFKKWLNYMMLSLFYFLFAFSWSGVRSSASFSAFCLSGRERCLLRTAGFVRFGTQHHVIVSTVKATWYGKLYVGN